MASLNSVFAALADPTRRALIERLADGEASVGELAAPFRISPPAVSRHLKILEAADLIERERAGQHIRLRLRSAALAPVTAWLRACSGSRHDRAAAADAMSG